MQTNRIEIKHVLQCKFCGGKDCKYEDYTKWTATKNTHIAIEGLYSNWITDYIIATQRPSSRKIKEHNIIKQFKERQINAIINLQLAGEHPECGDGLAISEGFSYLPEEFMNHEIFYYNFGWEDLTTPPFELALNAVQVMDFTIRYQNKRVAIHCHAGLGRTGTIIACYLHMYERMKPTEAVEHVRRRRPKSLQTKEQVEFISQFAEYVANLRTAFHTKISLDEIIKKQRKYLHGEELERFKNIPHVFYKICSRFKQILTTSKTIDWNHIHLAPISAEQEKKIVHLKKEMNEDLWKSINVEDDPVVLIQLLMQWIKQLQEPLISKEIGDKIANSNQDEIESILKELEDTNANTIFVLITNLHSVFGCYVVLAYKCLDCKF